MASSLRNNRPLTFSGSTLSDAADGTNAPRGAMKTLTNLIPNPTTRGTWVCRPGKEMITDFAGFNNPGAISALMVVGDTAYGMVASDRFPGFDEPFAYDLVNHAFLPVAGVTASNVPASQPATGEWTPPQIAQVGTRIIVTHPGFAGGSGDSATVYKQFGWFDISDFNQTVTGEVVFGTNPFLYGGFSVAGMQPGLLIANPLFSGTPTVARVFANTAGAYYFGADSHGTDILDGINIADIFNVSQIGKTVYGPGVQPGTIVIGVPAVDSIQISQPTTTTVTGGFFLAFGNLSSPYGLNKGDFAVGTNTILNAGTQDVRVGQLITAASVTSNTYVASIVGTTITMTQDAVGTQVNEAFAVSGAVIEFDPGGAWIPGSGSFIITGGSRAAPLWGAGDTLVNPLPSTPVGVAQFNGRAYFACGIDGIPYSDSLLACIRSNSLAVQALTTNDGLPVTALAPLMLQTPISGGIVGSLIAFQRDAKMQQILGDQATANLSMNPLNVATGTHAPNSICTTSLGTAFVSPEGVRFIGFDGKVTDPIGLDGTGIVQPFLNVTNPPIPGPAPASRMSAAANGRTLRVDVPLQDGTMGCYWYDLTRRIWTGPHTCRAGLVSTWSNTFVTTPVDGTAMLSRSDDVQGPTSVYFEDGVRLTWEWESCLLPDNAMMAMNAVIETALMVALPPGESVQINFLNETRGILDGVAISGLNISQAIWGQAIFGVTPLGPDTGVIRQRQVPWTVPLVFKQGTVNIRGNSGPDLIVGNVYLRYQILGYMLAVPG